LCLEVCDFEGLRYPPRVMAIIWRTYDMIFKYVVVRLLSFFRRSWHMNRLGDAWYQVSSCNIVCLTIPHWVYTMVDTNW
jgi:hypothetical protein